MPAENYLLDVATNIFKTVESPNIFSMLNLDKNRFRKYRETSPSLVATLDRVQVFSSRRDSNSRPQRIYCLKFCEKAIRVPWYGK